MSNNRILVDTYEARVGRSITVVAAVEEVRITTYLTKSIFVVYLYRTRAGLSGAKGVYKSHCAHGATVSVYLQKQRAISSHDFIIRK
jgi:hypothetical protein